MNTKKKLRDDERAVSPVVGVILMVAITVIMAAIIGAFVYGYGGSMVSAKNVAAVAHFTNKAGTDYVAVTYMGGPDQGEVSSLDAMVVKEDGSAVGTPVGTLSGVGTTETFPNADDRGKNHVVVTAVFLDGTSGVILDTYV